MSLNVVPEITTLTRQQSARLVKEARLKKKLSQTQLAHLSRISLRSLQRIENAEVLPRDYTWQQLGEHIDLEPAELSQLLPTAESNTSVPAHKNVTAKWILSIGALAVIILAFASFVIQSPTFPETPFETINMVLAGCIIYLIALYRIWK